MKCDWAVEVFKVAKKGSNWRTLTFALEKFAHNQWWASD